MAVELIAHDPANETRVARLRPQVAHEIARLRDVVDSLLSFSRSPRIERAPTDLAGVVSRAIATLSELAAERGVAVDGARAGARCARAATRTRCRASSSTWSRTRSRPARRSTCAAAAPTSEAIIEVADDGPGLSAEARSTCSSRSSRRSRTARGWGCRPRAASSRRTAAASRSRRRRRWAARCSGCGCRWTRPTRRPRGATEARRA